MDGLLKEKKNPQDHKGFTNISSFIFFNDTSQGKTSSFGGEKVEKCVFKKVLCETILIDLQIGAKVFFSITDFSFVTNDENEKASNKFSS